MTPDRFRSLIASHGADASRWPEGDREPARALLLDDAALQHALAEEAELDALLAQSAVAPPDAALLARVAAAAITPRRDDTAPARWKRWLLPGAGLAGIGLAGSLAGALAVSVALRVVAPSADAEWIERGSSFAEVPMAWSEE